MTTTTYTFESLSSYTLSNANDFDNTGDVLKLKQAVVSSDYTEDFADDTGFTYDNTKAEFTGGKVQQKKNSAAENYSQDFSNDTGFTYNPSLAEFVGGVSRQLIQRPFQSTFGATYTNNIDGSWGNGTLTGTSYGGASVSGGKLDLSQNGIRHVTYPFTGNFANKSKGTIKLKLTPNYGGIPGSFVYYPIFTLYKYVGSQEDSIALWHFPDGSLRLLVYDPIIGAAVNANFGIWNQTLGTQYEIECSWDLINGSNKLFIDGVQKGSTNTQTAQISGLSYVVIGGSFSNVYNSRFFIDDVLFFSEIQHTSNYTAGYTVNETDYTETIVEAPIFNYAYIIESFEAPTITATNTPRYTVNGLYWDGSDWETSSNTYATAMSLSDWADNIGTFPEANFNSGVIVKTIFQGSNNISSISSITFVINEGRFLSSVVTMPEMEHTTDGTLIAFDELDTTETGSPRYTIQIGRSGNYLYYDGADWVTSDGSYSQASPETDFNTYKDDLNIDGETYGQFKIHFPDTNTQSSVDNLTVTVSEDGDYPTTNPTVYFNSSFKATNISYLIASLSEAGDDKIKFVFNRNGQDYWYNSVTPAWETSDGYAKSNEYSELSEAILDTLTNGNRYSIYVKVYLHSDDGTSTPELTNYAVTFDYAIPDPITPNIVDVEFFVHNKSGPVSGLVVYVRPYGQGYFNNGVFVKYDWDTLGTTDTNGYVHGDVYLQGDSKFWEFKIGKQTYKANLLDITDMNLKDAPIFSLIEDN